MKRNLCSDLLVGLIASLALLALVGAANAQGPDKSGPVPSLAPAGSVPSAAVGTAITYQGQLKRNGSPYTGSCNLLFTLYDQAAAGALQAGPIAGTPDPVAVAAGLFTVQIDFGNVFSGDDRWLDIQVKCTGDGAFTPMGARQHLTAAPYALGLRPGTTVAGLVSTALTVVSSAPQGTGLMGQADNGSNAWGLFGSSTSGIGVMAAGGDNASSPNTALRIWGGKVSVGGVVKPAFVLTVGVVSSGCSSLSSPLFNGDPNAMIFVTPLQTDLTVPATDVRVLYNPGTWYLCSPSLASGMRYNVLVINQ